MRKVELAVDQHLLSPICSTFSAPYVAPSLGINSYDYGENGSRIGGKICRQQQAFPSLVQEFDNSEGYVKTMVWIFTTMMDIKKPNLHEYLLVFNSCLTAGRTELFINIST